MIIIKANQTGLDELLGVRLDHRVEKGARHLKKIFDDTLRTFDRFRKARRYFIRISTFVYAVNFDRAFSTNKDSCTNKTS